MKRIAIVILNWNGEKLLKEFLPSVIVNSPEADIIVADNASDDASIDYISREYPQIRIIKNSTNLGFAGGYNEALRQVDSELYLLLNSDVEVTKNWLQPLLKAMEDEKVAGCQPKVLSYRQKDHFEHAGACGGFLDRDYFPFCRGRIFDHFEEDRGQYNEERDIFWATGAALLIRSSLFKDVSGFDTHFFAHMEEIDLCWRIKKLGYSFRIVPGSVVYHLGGGSLPYSSPRKVYLNFRNSLMMIIKNHTGLLFPKLFWRMSLDGIAAIRFLIRGEFSHFWAVLKAHMYQYRNLGRLLKERKQIRMRTIMDDRSGLYERSILWSYYVKRIKIFSELDQSRLRK